jgi:hypothetical protein
MSIDITLVFSIIVIILLVYFLVTDIPNYSSTKNENENEKDTPEEQIKKYIFLRNNDNMYLCLNEMTRFFYLSAEKEEAETFLLEYLEKPVKKNIDTENKPPQKKKYFKNKLTLKCSDGYYLGLKYTTQPQDKYDITANNNIKNNSNILTLKTTKKGKMMYATFYNGHLINVNEDKYLFSSKQANNVFLFELKKKSIKIKKTNK